MLKIFEPRGMNKRRNEQSRVDGWVGGRPDTWAGHYQDSPASRAQADVARMLRERNYAAEVADQIRRCDAELLDHDGLRNAGLTAEPWNPGIGVMVKGLDMAALTDEQVVQVWQLLMTRKVVFFRDQGHISRAQHLAFGKRFADVGLAFGRQNSLSQRPQPEEFPEILRLYADEANPFSASNWHSDVTWSDRPPLGSILLSRQSPPVGGDTVFVDAYALWDSLSPVLKEFLEGRFATHGRASRDEVKHPICRTHPVTGRKALYINPTFTNTICELSAEDSARLLAQLYSKMYSTPEYQCRYRWEDGSVAMWDNRSCQHYAVGDFWPHERKMERVTLLDPSEEDELPFWEDPDGERHYSEVMTSQEEISTPIGERSSSMD